MLTHKCHECGNPTLAKCDFCGHGCSDCRRCKKLPVEGDKKGEDDGSRDHLFKFSFQFSVKVPAIFRRSNSLKSTHSRKKSSSLKRRFSVAGCRRREGIGGNNTDIGDLDPRSSDWVDTKMTSASFSTVNRSGGRRESRLAAGDGGDKCSNCSRPMSRSASRSASRQQVRPEATREATQRSAASDDKAVATRISRIVQSGVAPSRRSGYRDEHSSSSKREPSDANKAQSRQQQQEQEAAQLPIAPLNTVWGHMTVTPERIAQRQESKEYSYEKFSWYF